MYQPGSPLADTNGFRTDVAREVKELGVPIVRYPGGNFVSGYNWLDGVGPKEKRPTVLERAWNSIETNQFGTNEFMDWCRLVGTEPLLGMNFGTGTAEMAVDYVEYLQSGARHEVERPAPFARLREAAQRALLVSRQRDGRAMADRPDAGREYGRKAGDAARQMRVIDRDAAADRLRVERHEHAAVPGLGSRSARRVLRPGRRPLASCLLRQHAGADRKQHGALPGDEPRHGSSDSRSGRGLRLRAGMRRSSKRLWLSFDEWNVWYRARSGDAVNGRRQFAPKLLEEVYNLEDALLVGGFVNTLLRNADRVRVGCIAQLVNVIAPLVTNDTGVLRQSTFFPTPGRCATRAGGCSISASSPTRIRSRAAGLQADFARNDQVPFVDIVATLDAQNGQACVLMLNRDLDGERELVLEWRDVTPTRVLACETLTARISRRSTLSNSRGASPRSGSTLRLPALA